MGLFLLTWSLPALVGALQGALGNLVPASGERNLGLPLHKRSLQITGRGEAFFLLAGQKVTRRFVGGPVSDQVVLFVYVGSYLVEGDDW